jgi:hypothetical protein
LDEPPAIRIGVMEITGPRMAAAHHECQLREVIGGIGHLIAHEYWCLEKHDPDGGLTFRQSALLTWEYVKLIGVDQTVERTSGQ